MKDPVVTSHEPALVRRNLLPFHPRFGFALRWRKMKTLLSGNETIARGAYEAGTVFTSAYPGTVSTVICKASARFSQIKAQWPPNEKDFRHRVLPPASARFRHPIIEDMLLELQEDTGFAILRLILQRPHLGIMASGVAYQHAREVFPDASSLKLGLTHFLPKPPFSNSPGRLNNSMLSGSSIRSWRNRCALTNADFGVFFSLEDQSRTSRISETLLPKPWPSQG